jgi:hypothetical protein
MKLPAVPLWQDMVFSKATKAIYPDIQSKRVKRITEKAVAIV